MENIILKGSFTTKDKIAPSYINLKNPKYIEIDNIFYSGLLIIDYPREQEEILLKNIVELNLNMNISIFFEKQDIYKTIKDLTYHIGNVSVDLQDTNSNRQDIEIATFTYNDAKYIRKQMQINNEDLYYLYIYINIFSEEKKSVEIKNATRRNILTTGLTGTYPFITSSIFDENGIFIGTNIYNNSLIFIDRYNKKYKNSNMCIFGTSGAGKSFYTKLIILRYRILGISQYIVDPEREYTKICESLEGTLIKLGPTSNTFINIFDIREDSLEEEDKGYLATKIPKLIGFFNLIFGNLNEEEKAILEEKIIQLYELKNITFDDVSLYKQSKNNNIKLKPEFKKEKDMPILEEFYNLLEKDKRTKLMKIKLIPFVKGSLKFFNNYTNIKLNNKLIVADVYELGEENLKYGMYLFTDLFWDKIKNNRNQKKAIYLDEIWRLIGVTSNKEVASFVYKIFKTIRKYGGSSIAITQDISDLFSLEDGAYGKSILNNSNIKNFFSLEEENIKVLEKYLNLSEKEKIEIKSLKRGECLMFVDKDHILTKIESSSEEKKLIM